MVKQVTKEQYLQLVGLLALAKVHNARLLDITESAKQVLEVTPEDANVHGVGDPDHINDAVYCEYPVEKMLQKLGVSLPRQAKVKGAKR